MADITFTYVPTDGAVLDPDGLNRNWHSVSDGESIYGELNGGLEAANLASGFRVRHEHLRPGETWRSREESGQETLDYYDRLWLTRTFVGEPELGPRQWVQVAHAQSRVYVPWDSTCVLYSISAFYTVFRMREHDPEAEEVVEETTGPDIILAMYIDNGRLTYTRRETPITYWPNTTTRLIEPYEQSMTQHLDIQHLAIAGSADDAQTLRGYHDVSLRIWGPRNYGREVMCKPFEANPVDLIQYSVGGRIRFGVRSARVTAFP